MVGKPAGGIPLDASLRIAALSRGVVTAFREGGSNTISPLRLLMGDEGDDVVAASSLRSFDPNIVQ